MAQINITIALIILNKSKRTLFCYHNIQHCNSYYTLEQFWFSHIGTCWLLTHNTIYATRSIQISFLTVDEIRVWNTLSRWLIVDIGSGPVRGFSVARTPSPSAALKIEIGMFQVWIYGVITWTLAVVYQFSIVYFGERFYDRHCYISDDIRGVNRAMIATIRGGLEFLLFMGRSRVLIYESIQWQTWWRLPIWRYNPIA